MQDLHLNFGSGSILSQSYSIDHLNATPQFALLLFLMPKKYVTAEERCEARLASKHRHYTRSVSQIYSQITTLTEVKALRRRTRESSSMLGSAQV
jgi:hypothetical protein